MTDRNRFAAWAGLHSDKNWHYSVLQAIEALRKVDTAYMFDQGEWCTEWSDIYYIPRHLWPDFIYLSAFFGAFNCFHEMTIPTMVHILDQSRREKPFTSIINWIGDCYGGCCNRGGDIEDYIAHRCGHSIDYLGDEHIFGTHYQRLEQVAITLGKPSITPAWKKLPNSERYWKTYIRGLSNTAMAAFEKSVKIKLKNAYQKKSMPDAIPFNHTGLEPEGADPFTYWYRMKPPRPFNITEMEENDRAERELELTLAEPLLPGTIIGGEPPTETNTPMLDDPQLQAAAYQPSGPKPE